MLARRGWARKKGKIFAANKEDKKRHVTVSEQQDTDSVSAGISNLPVSLSLKLELEGMWWIGFECDTPWKDGKGITIGPWMSLCVSEGL